MVSRRSPARTAFGRQRPGTALRRRIRPAAGIRRTSAAGADAGSVDRFRARLLARGLRQEHRRTSEPPALQAGGGPQESHADPHRAQRGLRFFTPGDPGMRFSSWLPDTIARRFAVTEVLAVAVTLMLVGLFKTFGGVWSNDPLEQSSLLTEAADIVRMIDAAPPTVRQTLAAPAGPNVFQVGWYAAGSRAAASLEAAPRSDDENTQKKISAHVQRAAVVLRPDRAGSVPPGIGYDRSAPLVPYMLAVQLRDGSWLVFSVMQRTWGMPWADRWLVWLCFLAVSITVVTGFAARQFSKPIERLAAAGDQLRLNPPP